jgi:hypothetical protein
MKDESSERSDGDRPQGDRQVPVPGKHRIFCQRIRGKNGKVRYARDYGLKAWCIWVKDKE